MTIRYSYSEKYQSQRDLSNKNKMILSIIYKICFLIGFVAGNLILISALYKTNGSPVYQVMPSASFYNDFADFWGGARLYWLNDISSIFDPTAFDHWMTTVFRPGSIQPFSSWSYPPPMLLLLLPFGWLPIGAALILWLAINYGSLGLASFAIRQKLDLVMVTCLSPASLYAFKEMQNGPVLAALLLTGIWFVETRPVLAGICFGLLAAKPQLAMLVPVVLLAGRHWRSLSVTILTFALLILASLALFGMQAWIDYFTKTAPFMEAQLAHPYPIWPAYAMPTIFILGRSLGVGASAAMALQVCTTLALVAFVGYLWSGDRVARPWRNGLTCLIVPLATPFAYVYDMIPAMFAIAYIVTAEEGLFSIWLVLGAAVVWVWPSLGVIGTTSLRLPQFGALAILLLVVAAFRGARRPAPVASPN